MKVAAVIAEYNPFHNGHEYQLRRIRELSKADAIVAVMSGNFVQRGEPAIVNKYVRTGMALEAGADLILELPVAAASGSAGDFSLGAVSILEGLGCVDELWFGAESDDRRIFDLLSGILSAEPEVFRRSLREKLAAGYNFPSARAYALAEALRQGHGAEPDIQDLSKWTGEEINEFLRGSNNILGLEYCTALKKLGSNINPMILKRRGSGYLDTEIEGRFASAMAIRTEIVKESGLWKSFPAEAGKKISSRIPEASMAILQDHLSKHGIVELDDFSDMLGYQLMYETAESLVSFRDVGQDLANRIISLRDKYTTISGFAGLLRTRNKTQTAVQRALIHILLRIDDKVPDFDYVRALGFVSGTRVMHEIKKKGTIKLITRASGLNTVNAGTDIAASDLYEMVRARKAGDLMRKELTRQMVIK